MIDERLLAPLEVPAAHVAVLERLRRAIALGLVAPGERFPSERALAAAFGVARVTVREALRVLQDEGLIVTKRGGGGGAIVASWALTRAGSRADPSTREGIDEVFEFRLAVETMAARLAAERRTAQQLEALGACQRALLASDGIGDFRRADSEFHLTVAAASGNQMLHNAIVDARASTFNVLDARTFELRLEATASAHGRILKAIAARRPDSAARAMTAHLHAAREEVVEALFGGD
jgi:DNA-binding FadR family transcriptional regulator